MTASKAKDSKFIFKWRDQLHDDDRVPCEVTPTAYRISKLYDGNLGYAYPSMNYLVEYLGLSDRTIRSHIDLMVSAGYLSKERKEVRGGNRYCLHLPPHTHSRDVRLKASKKTARPAKSDVTEIASSAENKGSAIDLKSKECTRRELSDRQIIRSSSADSDLQIGKKRHTTSFRTSFTTSSKGAAPSSPAPLDRTESRSTGVADTPASALRAADAASGGSGWCDYTPPTLTVPSVAERRLSDREYSSAAIDLQHFVGRAEDWAARTPELARQDYRPPTLTVPDALTALRANPSSDMLVEDADLIWRRARLGERDLDLARDAPVLMELVSLLNGDQLPDDIAWAALSAHRRLWAAHHTTLAMAAFVTQAEHVAGTTMAELLDDEVPF